MDISRYLISAWYAIQSIAAVVIGGFAGMLFAAALFSMCGCSPQVAAKVPQAVEAAIGCWESIMASELLACDSEECRQSVRDKYECAERAGECEAIEHVIAGPSE